jgi:hypothetical protein
VKYMRTFSVRSDKFVFFATIMILFASTIWISSVSALPQQQTSLGVKITNPAKGQQLAIGKNLTLSGTSSYDTTSNCGVFVIVDGVRPYQKTMPIGQAVGNNYSKWKYSLTPDYAGIIKEGTNRITAKLLCKADPVNLTKFYSINVTGTNEIVLKHPMITRNTAVPVSSNNLSYLFQQTPLINHLSFPTSSSDSSDSARGGGYHHHSTSTSTSSFAFRNGRHHHSTSTSSSSDSSDTASGGGYHHHSTYGKDHSNSKSSRHHDGYDSGDRDYGGGDGGYGGGDGGYGGGDGGYGGGDGYPWFFGG